VKDLILDVAAGIMPVNSSSCFTRFHDLGKGILALLIHYRFVAMKVFRRIRLKPLRSEPYAPAQIHACNILGSPPE
jgi:hypothetical protein